MHRAHVPAIANHSRGAHERKTPRTPKISAFEASEAWTQDPHTYKLRLNGFREYLDLTRP